MAWFIFMFFYAGYYGVRQIIRAVRWWQRTIREHKQRADDEDDMLRRVMASHLMSPGSFRSRDRRSRSCWPTVNR